MFGKIVSCNKTNQVIEITFEKQTGYVMVISSNIFRVYANFDGIRRKSKAIEEDKTKTTEVTLEQNEEGITISTKDVTAIIRDNFKIDFYDSTGNLVCEDYRGQRKDTQGLSKEAIALLEGEGHKVDLKQTAQYAIEVVKSTNNLEAIYGLGDKTGFLNKLGYEYEMWNTDEPAPQVDSFRALYKSIPFYIALTKKNIYGIFFDTTYHSYFNLAKESQEYYYFAANKGDLDYYYIAGGSIAQIVEEYTYLTGRAPLPQLFTLGYQQSRWSYESEEKVRNIAELMRKYEIPCDTIHLDIDYMDSYKVFTWGKKNYTDGKKMISDLANDGFKIVTIIDPGVKVEKGYDVYEEGIKNDYFAKDANGDVYENVVWPGDSVYPDFGKEKVRKWWAEKQKFLVDMGVRGVWNDMNEPASFRGPLPDDVVFYDEDRETNHLEMHNVYGHLMAKATYEGLKKYDQRRPYIITRACYAGTQKYSTAWTGDNHSIWSHLQMAIPQLLNLSLSGMVYVGTDIGGFSSDCTPELMARWVQVGCFSPLFRNHSAAGTRYQEPWQFGEEVLNIYRKYVELRYKLIPYFYDLFHVCEQKGYPIIRPLVFHYEDDLEVRNMNDEFMVGENILVAPVVNQGQKKRLVYLPKGDWYDYHTKEKIEGGKYIIRETPLDICPIYVKAGSIIPTYPKQQFIGEKNIDTLTLEVYGDNGKYVHYQDDGESFDYQNGKYNEYEFTTNNHQLTIKINNNGYAGGYRGFAKTSIE